VKIRKRMSKKTLIGKVVTSSQKTISVEVERQVKNRLYQKMQKIHKKILAHDETMQAKVGEMVEIIETKPRSLRKSWALSKVLK